jgi:hypothetical protein
MEFNLRRNRVICDSLLNSKSNAREGVNFRSVQLADINLTSFFTILFNVLFYDSDKCNSGNPELDRERFEIAGLPHSTAS